MCIYEKYIHSCDVIERAFEKAEFVRLPKVEQDKYHKNLKVYRDLLNSFNTARNEGLKKGRKEGREEGLEEGMKKKAFEIAMSLLDVLDVETIALKIGLSVDDIELLKSSQ